ncbi:hypothetical protein K435DRAFT_807792 [Dendrothele bispora CBS 962.96]|uniref:SWR1-complex protein 5 n=1 Tax=Dendrothele bispora (strain CBS 962.96) TaxID=1314807 RepID=A0A4S8L3L3_DENBC|nr:hypothetical protein K435DRAFT_807792 [Dendrothele bispora CBS 962.96]
MMLSDSEDDGEYVPPANDVESSSSDSDNGDGPITKRARISSPGASEDPEAKKKAREELWKSFKESVNSEPSSSSAEIPKMVKVEKRYRFAGEEVVEIMEVPENSADAKKWPVWTPTSHEPGIPATIATTESSSTTSSSVPKTISPNPPPTDTSKSSTSTPLLTSSASTKPGPKRPGPRKPKVTLTSLPSSSEPKKLTTLEKSAMDWRAHVNSVDEGTKDELEANRKEGGGGYLEKVEFLERVSERREGVLETSKSGSGKRRR